MVGGYLAAVLCSEHRTNRTCDVYAPKYKRIAHTGVSKNWTAATRSHSNSFNLYIFFTLAICETSVFFTLLLLYILLRLVCSLRICVLLLFLLIYSVHLKLFANFI